ncbi:alternative ribosome rescue aminoacyl-tRNA hydrolase ArfB [Flagellimonas myxillae]|uniref:alternative ribosome rescue aminoacyl-tRNA hydrolase ArfB n=1 Tax=Flagellimonas myxillae TaxID=2942214 RepID=UPI00201FB193|nr:alternative ribosome rescue aminoacyl-tRNA hydrolase ArfB [Muricauda myxillae]MCL6266533.1 aminoacyl-tRNA hydrolase [Muricauda myxillae]
MNKEQIRRELQFKAIRSSGAGGQHVNKVSSKVELVFSIKDSVALTEHEKERLLTKLGSRLTKEGMLVLQCGESRSQHKNKALVVERFFALLKNGLHVPKKRRPTKPSKSSVEKRLKSKKLDSRKKTDRQKPKWD